MNEINELELRKFYRLVRDDLEKYGVDNFPGLSLWGNEKESREVLEILLRIAKTINETYENFKMTTKEKEEKIIKESESAHVSIKKINGRVELKKQKLCEIQTEISKIKLDMKDSRHKFLLKQNPKLQKIQNLEKRKLLLERHYVTD